MKWDYKVVRIDLVKDGDIEARLKYYGDRDWELVGPIKDGMSFVFKRPIDERTIDEIIK